MLYLYAVLCKRLVKYSFILLLLWLSSFSPKVLAQSFAMRGGYHIGFTESKVMNAIVDQYNNTRTWLTKPMPRIKFLDGFHVGLQFRYKIPFELMWVGRYRKILAEGAPLGQPKGIRSLDLQYHGVSVGLIPIQLKKVPIGFGLSLDFNTLKFDTQRSEQPKETLVQQFNFASSLFISIQIPIIKQLLIDIRPYVQIPIGKVNVYPVEQSLDPQNSSKQDPTLFKTNFLNVGGSVSIVYSFWEARKKKKLQKIDYKPLIDRVKPAVFCADLYILLKKGFNSFIVEGSMHPNQELAGALDSQLNIIKQQITYVYARNFSLEAAQKNYNSLSRRIQNCLKKGSYSIEEQILSEGRYQTTTFYLQNTLDTRASTISILYTCSKDQSYADVDLIIVYP